MSQDQPKPDNDPTSVFGSGDATPSDPTAPGPQSWGQQPSGPTPGQAGQGGYAQQPAYDPNAYNPNAYPAGGYDPNAYGQQPGAYDPNAYGQQPGYGQAYPGYDAYGQPAYGQYPAQPGYAQPQGTNTMAILALVFAFVFPILGLVFGIIARGQIKTSGEQGDGLALAGIIISVIWLVLIVLFFILFFAVFATAVNSVPTYR